MHAYISVLANQANVYPSMGSCVVVSMSKEQGSARAWRCMREGIVCGSPGVLLNKAVKGSALCQVCRASSSASACVTASR